MDVEKTMEFLLDRAAHHDQQMAQLTAKVDELTGDVAEIARATRMLIDDRQFLSGKLGEVIEQQKLLTEHQKMLAEQQRAFSIERNEDRKYYDRRFDQMVSAIGEFMRLAKPEPPLN